MPSAHFETQWIMLVGEHPLGDAREKQYKGEYKCHQELRLRQIDPRLARILGRVLIRNDLGIPLRRKPHIIPRSRHVEIRRIRSKNYGSMQQTKREHSLELCD